MVYVTGKYKSLSPLKSERKIAFATEIWSVVGTIYSNDKKLYDFIS